MANPTPKRIAERFMAGMTVMICNVAGHNWGWFSKEDERMHLQSVEAGAQSGPQRVKFWLEQKGARIFELAEGNVSGPDQKKLRERVRSDREHLEELWIAFMIQNDWLDYRLEGHIVTLTAYPKSHNKFSCKIDLRVCCPGAFKGEDTWETRPPKVSLDREQGMLTIGHSEDPDLRRHIKLTDYIFTGPK